MYRDGDDVDEEEWVNYHAVLNAYRSGHLDVDPDKLGSPFRNLRRYGHLFQITTRKGPQLQFSRKPHGTAEYGLKTYVTVV
jgi:hypothetical protein